MAWAVIDSLNSPTAGAFTFASLTLTGYKVIQVRGTGITVTTDGTDPRLTLYVSGSEVTSTYTWGTMISSTGGTGNADQASAQASILLVSNDANWDVGNASTKACGFALTIDAPVSTALHKKVGIDLWAIGPTGNAIAARAIGQMDNAGAITGLKIGGTSNLTAGKVRILGLT
jgi:hypothetical protein